MAGMLTDLGLVVTDAVGYVGDVADMIVATPLLLLPVGFFVIGGAAGLLRRFFV